ncbi:MAG: hypothetical protein PVH61_39890 [Candidatus Aminicenantes bacterium]|jgi:hypothetical protein
METLVFDTVIEDGFLKIPQKYKNKRVKVIIIDSEEKEGEKKKAPRKLNFKIDETLDDVVPFSDIKDTKKFAKELREAHWK